MNPVDIEVGRRVRERRMLLGMSQAKLAEELGVSFQQVQKYEKGLNRISGSRLHLASKVLDIPVSQLFPDAEVPEGSVEMPSSQAIWIAQAYERIADPDMREAIRVLILAASKKVD